MSSGELLQLPSLSNPSDALHLSQRAPDALRRPPPTTRVFPLSLLSEPESPDTWTEYEQLLLACLRVGDDKSAHLCLKRLSDRFGASDERVMGLRGLYQEAVAKGFPELETLLKEYNKILKENLVNVPILKRRVALLQSMQRPIDAITCLVDYLEHFPTDVEGWVQLGELYQFQGLFPQAIFSLEEALLVTPNAWNLHARLGELDYVAAEAAPEGSDQEKKLLVDALQRFSRALELCDDYVRALYGLKLTCTKLLKLIAASKVVSDDPSPDAVQRLEQMASSRLRSIVKAFSEHAAQSKHSERDIIAAKELLDRN